MAAIDYPTSLPNPRGGEFDEGGIETKVRDESDVGAPRRRNRFTRSLGRWRFRIDLDGTQRAALLTFYETTLDRGVEAFNWTHPTTGTSYEVEMVSRPSITHVSADYWQAGVDLQEI